MDSLSFLTLKMSEMQSETDEQEPVDVVCAMLLNITEEQQRFITGVGHGHCHALMFLLAFLEFWTNNNDAPPKILRTALEKSVKAMTNAIELDDAKHALPYDLEAFYA